MSAVPFVPCHFFALRILRILRILRFLIFLTFLMLIFCLTILTKLTKFLFSWSSLSTLSCHFFCMAILTFLAISPISPLSPVHFCSASFVIIVSFSSQTDKTVNTDMSFFYLLKITFYSKTLVIAYILLNHSLFILGPLCLYSWMDHCVISSF